MDRPLKQLQGVVPVADAVQGVGHGGGEAQRLCRLPPVDGVGGARQGAGAQGALVQALCAVLQPGHVPAEHGGVGHQVLGKGDGLGPLQVGVAGHDGGLVLFRLPAEHRLQLQQLGHDHRDLLPDVHPEVQGHLVVPGAGGVEPLARVPDPGGEQRLHVHVDVLVVGGEFHLPSLDVRQDAREPRLDGVAVRLGDDAAVREHLGVGHGAGDVLFVQPLVKADGGIELVHQLVGLFLEASAPEFHKPLFLSSRRRGEKISPPRSCDLADIVSPPPGHIENHFSPRRCTWRKYFDPSRRGRRSPVRRLVRGVARRGACSPPKSLKVSPAPAAPAPCRAGPTG